MVILTQRGPQVHIKNISGKLVGYKLQKSQVNYDHDLGHDYGNDFDLDHMQDIYTSVDNDDENGDNGYGLIFLEGPLGSYREYIR